MIALIFAAALAAPFAAGSFVDRPSRHAWPSVTTTWPRAFVLSWYLLLWSVQQKLCLWCMATKAAPHSGQVIFPNVRLARSGACVVVVSSV